MQLKSKHDLILVEVEVRKYGGTKTLRPQDYGLEKWPKGWKPGSHQSFEQWMEFWRKFATEVKGEVQRYSLPHPLKNVNAIPRELWEKQVRPKLEKRRQEMLEEHLPLFISVFDDLIAQEEKEHGGEAWWERVRLSYPSKKDLPYLFDIRWMVFVMGPHFNGTGEDVTEEVKAEYREQLKAIADMQIKHLRKVLLGSFSIAKKAFDEGKIVQNQTLESLRRAIQQYKMLNMFVPGESQLDKEIDKLFPTLEVVDSELLKDNSALYKNFTALALSVEKAASDIKDIEVTVDSYVRKVEL